jgi:hypothetical protein
MDVFDAPDLVDRQDSRVVDCRRGPCFLHEAADAIRLSRESVGQDLERNLAVELRIEGEMDFSHSTRCNWSNDLVMTEPAARRDGDDDALLDVGEGASIASATKSCKEGGGLKIEKQLDNSQKRYAMGATALMAGLVSVHRDSILLIRTPPGPTLSQKV